MNPTDEQLRDPKWWDENAPKDAKYYFEPKSGNKNPAFFARTCSGNTGTNCSGESYHVFFQYWGQPIPRPTKPASPEWDGETFIQAGHRLQARVNDNPWLSGEITYRSDSGVVFRPDDGGDELFWRFELFDVEFRPIRTKEQRQRDELAVEIWSLDGRSKDHAYSVADHILSRFNLEPKDD